jgi:translation initiation factor 2D
MFKKPSDVDVSRSSALGGKDVKKFKSRCLALLPNLDDAGFDELFPGKSVMKTKLKIGAVIYVNVDAIPMILDPSNDHMDVAIPSVYALALLPELVPNIEVNASAVSSTMMRGSDLFLQGVNRDALVAGPPLLAGQLRSVRVPGNPIPFAVGTMTVSSREAEEAGWSGRGLITKHVYGDELWKTGDRMVPNCGFEASSVGPCGIDEGAIANELADKASLGASREADGEASVSPGYDEIVMNICLGALLSCRSGELPLSVDAFVTGKMAPLRPRGMASLDIKKTSWKRAAKLLGACQDLGMCKLKNVRKEMSVVEINREHGTLRSYHPLELDAGEDEDRSADDRATIRVLYKSPTVFLPLLGLDHKTDLISETEIEKKLDAYWSGSCDDFLLDNLFGKKERQGVDPETVSIDEIRKRLLSKLTKQTIFERRDPVTNRTIQVLIKGSMSQLRLMVLRRQGRLMTVVTGFEEYGFDSKELAESLAKRMKTNAFAAAASDSKSGASEVCLLGDWVQKRTGDHYLPSFFIEQGLSNSMLDVDVGRKKK